MPYGYLTENWDVAQVVLYAFWLFFAGLIFYLRREDRREGYPLVTENGGTENHGAIWVPDPKPFVMPHGDTVYAPRAEIDNRVPNFKPALPGYPADPAGDPLVDGIGPAAYALRRDEPDMTLEGDLKIVPLRADREFYIPKEDPDPRGWLVYAAEGECVGKVVDIWVDRSEHVIRYFETELNGGRRILVPAGFTDLAGKKITITRLYAKQFANVPATKAPGQVTLLEEDRIQAYFAGGKLLASPDRQEPFL